MKLLKGTSGWHCGVGVRAQRSCPAVPAQLLPLPHVTLRTRKFYLSYLPYYRFFPKCLNIRFFSPLNTDVGGKCGFEHTKFTVSPLELHHFF